MPLGTEKIALLGAAAPTWEWDLMDSNCSSTSDGGSWTLGGGSAGGGCTQVTYDGQSTFKCDSGGNAVDGANGWASLSLANSDLSSATVWPDTFTVQTRIYLHTIGTHGSGASNDQASIYLQTQQGGLGILFTSPYPGSGPGAPYGTRNYWRGGGVYPPIGAITDNWVGAWHTFGIYVHDFQNSNPYVQWDAYGDGTLLKANCYRTGTDPYNATFVFGQNGYANTHRISYIDWVRIGTGDGRSVLTA